MDGYIAGLSCLALVLSPLFIPIAVTVVHWGRSWRHIPHAVKPAAAKQLRAPAPKAIRRPEPASGRTVRRIPGRLKRLPEELERLRDELLVALEHAAVADVRVDPHRCVRETVEARSNEALVGSIRSSSPFATSTGCSVNPGPWGFGLYR